MSASDRRTGVRAIDNIGCTMLRFTKRRHANPSRKSASWPSCSRTARYSLGGDTGLGWPARSGAGSVLLHKACAHFGVVGLITVVKQCTTVVKQCTPTLPLQAVVWTYLCAVSRITNVEDPVLDAALSSGLPNRAHRTQKSAFAISGLALGSILMCAVSCSALTRIGFEHGTPH